MRKVLTDLYAIFYWANPDDCPPYCREKAIEYKQNRALFEKKAKYFTKKYFKLFILNANPCDKNWDFSYDEKDLDVKES